VLVVPSRRNEGVAAQSVRREDDPPVQDALEDGAALGRRLPVQAPPLLKPTFDHCHRQPRHRLKAGHRRVDRLSSRFPLARSRWR
jgi:hypothetical protein